MALDPAAGFPLTPAGRLEARIRELERRAEANPGAQAGGGFALDTLTISVGVNEGLIAPAVDLVVPEPGAFIQIYAEGEAQQTDAGPGDLEVWVAENIGPPQNQVAVSRMIRWPGPAGAWLTGTLTNVDGGTLYVPDDTTPGAQARALPGTVLQKWTFPGLHKFALAARINSGAATFQIRNRRLMVRVLQ